MRILGIFKVIITLVPLVSSMLLFSFCASSTAAGSSQNISETDENGYEWRNAGGDGGHGGGH